MMQIDTSSMESTDLFPREPSPIESTPKVVESKGVEQYGITEKHIQKVDQIPKALEAESTTSIVYMLHITMAILGRYNKVID